MDSKASSPACQKWRTQSGQWPPSGPLGVKARGQRVHVYRGLGQALHGCPSLGLPERGTCSTSLQKKSQAQGGSGDRMGTRAGHLLVPPSSQSYPPSSGCQAQLHPGSSPGAAVDAAKPHTFLGAAVGSPCGLEGRGAGCAQPRARPVRPASSSCQERRSASELSLW